MNIEHGFDSSVLCAWYAPLVPVFIGNGFNNCYTRYYTGTYTRNGEVDFNELLNEIKRK